MSPLPPLPAVSRVVLTSTYAGIATANVLHYRGQTQASAPNASAIGARIVANLTGPIRGVTPTTAVYTGIKVTPLDPAEGPPTEYATGFPIAGTNPSPQLPNNVTLVTTFRTAFGGRSYRGRAYHIGLSEGAVTNNTVSETERAAIQAFWESMRVLEAGTGENVFELVVVSYYSGGLPRAVPIATAVESVTTNNRVDTQRRRLS